MLSETNSSSDPNYTYIYIYVFLIFMITEPTDKLHLIMLVGLEFKTFTPLGHPNIYVVNGDAHNYIIHNKALDET